MDDVDLENLTMMMQTMTTTLEIFDRLGIAGKPGGFAIGGRYEEGSGPRITTVSPIDGESLKDVGTASAAEVVESIDAAVEAFRTWRTVPAPVRGA